MLQIMEKLKAESKAVFIYPVRFNKMVENNILNEISNRLNKLKVALKELRETEVWLKIIVRARLIQPITKLSPLLQETDEVISILFKSIDTEKKKNER